MGAAAVVLGASGYAGGELLRYLSMHPGIEVTAASAAGKAGSEVAQVLPHLATSDLRLRPVEDVLSTHADVVFSCLPADVRPSFDPATCIIDLSDAHRADPAWTYGLPEFDRRGITEARRIANPGCYPTAALLALVPFVHQQVIDGPVVVDALSGTSGAGRKQEDRLLHASVDSSAAAYGTVDHRHVPEIERGLARFGGEGMTVSFTPHLVPMSRGLLVTARGRLRKPLDDRDAVRILVDAYGREPFVSVIEGWPSTKSVAGTNRALVAARVDKRAGMLVCSAAIDNLGKGAAGQALQNANLVLGLDETTGLEAVAAWP
ncbi:MAG: N-acetyl-gamma-glutamyl-phosphate reductase [Actinobacteria bacterium]|nr:N-acetyl-gamma-glutamyl-phosphate reductase [Actinomycetota bacterium]